MRPHRHVLRRIVVATCLATVAALGTAGTASATHDLRHHWAHNGQASSRIYIVDHTGARWPVGRATYKWNEARGVDAYYHLRCPSTLVHCVHVYEINKPNGWYGLTFFKGGWNSARHNNEGVVVRLNNYYVRTETQAWKTACHELGHVLGLDHTRTSNATCMTSGAAPPISKYPDAHDFAQLRLIYAHPN